MDSVCIRKGKNDSGGTSGFGTTLSKVRGFEQREEKPRETAEKAKKRIGCDTREAPTGSGWGRKKWRARKECGIQ